MNASNSTTLSDLLKNVIRDAPDAAQIFANKMGIDCPPHHSAFNLVDAVRRSAIAYSNEAKLNEIDSALVDIVSQIEWHDEFPNQVTRTLFVLTEYFPADKLAVAFTQAVVRIANDPALSGDGVLAKNNKKIAARAILPTWRRVLDRIPSATYIRQVLNCGLHLPSDYFVDFVFAWRLNYFTGESYATTLTVWLREEHDALRMLRAKGFVELPLTSEESLIKIAQTFDVILDRKNLNSLDWMLVCKSMRAAFLALIQTPETQNWAYWLEAEVLQKSRTYIDFSRTEGILDDMLYWNEEEDTNDADAYLLGQNHGFDSMSDPCLEY
jgi:hypothetical protein